MSTLGVAIGRSRNEFTADVEACVLESFGCQYPIALTGEDFRAHQVPRPPADLQLQGILKLASSGLRSDFAPIMLQTGHVDGTDVIYSFNDESGCKC